MKVVIIGSGFGGVKSALELQNLENIKVSLISSRNTFEYHAALYRSATGKSPLEVVIPLRDIFIGGQTNVEIILDEIIKILPDNKQIHGSSGRNYKYDLLILAIGQETNYYNISDLAEYSYSIDSIKSTIKLREHLHKIVLNQDLHKLNFVIVGGGASGVELSAELKFYINDLCAYHKLANKKVDVQLIEAGQRVLPLLHPKVSALALKHLLKIGVKVDLNNRVQGISKNLLQTSKGLVQSKTVVWAAGFKNNSFYANQDKGIFKYGKAGRVKIDGYLRAQKDVYVIGDSADTEYSGMAQTALHDARFVAKDIMIRQSNKKPRLYKPHEPIYAIPVGRHWAILQWGKFHLSGYPAWVFRRVADLRLFIQLEPLKKAIKTWRHGERHSKSSCSICKNIDTY